MNLKRIAAVTISIIFVLVIVTAVIWTYLIASYVSDLGTSNVIEVSTDESTSNASSDNQLAKLSFESDAENLSWSSVEINLMIDGERYPCTFGSQSIPTENSSYVSSNLGADGKTFTTEIDATDSESYTYFDVSEQQEANKSSYWMKFSTTDVYLGDGVSWKFISDASFSEVNSIPSDLSNETNDRLNWYEYDMSVHRVIPNDGVYVIQMDNKTFKIKFLTYYNSDDESRYPTMLISAIDNSSFPALNNPDLVKPSPCKIVSDDYEEDYWNANETISLFENRIDLCNGICIISLDVVYETVDVKIDNPRFEIG